MCTTPDSHPTCFNKPVHPSASADSVTAADMSASADSVSAAYMSHSRGLQLEVQRHTGGRLLSRATREPQVLRHRRPPEFPRRPALGRQDDAQRLKVATCRRNNMLHEVGTSEVELCMHVRRQR